MDPVLALAIAGALGLMSLAAWLRLCRIDAQFAGRKEAIEARFLIAISITTLAIGWVCVSLLVAQRGQS